MLSNNSLLPQSLSSSSSSSASTSLLSCSKTIFRVRRKRTADPHGALVISLKRAKGMPATEESISEPIICLRASATDLRLGFGGIKQSQQLNVIDVDPHRDNVNKVEPHPLDVDRAVENGDSENNSSVDNFLELMQDAPEEASASNKIIGEAAVRPSEITLNGQPLALLNVKDDEDFIFDYYWSSKADGCTAHQIREIRLADADDLLMYDGEDTESSVEDGDDEDSNNEDNWRNDYPDESEHTSECDSGEDTTSDESHDCGDLEKHMGELGFCDGEGSEDGDD